MLGWHTKVEQFVHGPDMIGQSRCHRRGYWLPLFARASATVGWERARQALPQSPMRYHKVIVGESQRELMFQVVRIFREGIDLASHPARVLPHRQIVALHAIGVDGLANGRSP